MNALKPSKNRPVLLDQIQTFLKMKKRYVWKKVESKIYIRLNLNCVIMHAITILINFGHSPLTQKFVVKVMIIALMKWKNGYIKCEKNMGDLIILLFLNVIKAVKFIGI